MKTIIENLGDILPVIVFIVIAIASSMGGKKKPKDEGAPVPAPVPPEAPEPVRQTPRSPQKEYRADRDTRASKSYDDDESFDDELRKTLEEIFQAKSPQTKTLPKEKTRVSTAAATEGMTRRGSVDNEWDRTVAERKAKDAARTKAKAAAKEERRAAALVPCDVHEISSMNADGEQGVTAPINLEYASAAQARNGFVWSEILAAPVGMRG